MTPDCPENTIALRMETLGCKVNQYESDLICGDLIQNGGFRRAAGEPPRLVIINTCTVTKKAAMQSRQMIRRAIRTHPAAVIIATGCLAQTEPDVLARIKGIDYIIGNAEKANLFDLFSKSRFGKTVEPVIRRSDVSAPALFEQSGFPITAGRSRPFIKIQDGCDQFCTYCIVPYARGPSRSRLLESIAGEIRLLAEKGHLEVVLTGIHIGRWGHDFSPPSNLKELLAAIHSRDLIRRIRLSSIEPLEVTDALLAFAKDSGRLCPHWHIPLQSGDDEVLKRMNRPYSSDIFSDRVTQIRRLMPDAAIGVDVMAGFPGETDAAFERTLFLLEALPVTYLHAFPFSRRAPAPAARFPDQVPTDRIKARADALGRLGLRKKAAFYDMMIGKTLSVMVESRRDRGTGSLMGVSENYVRVMLDGDDGLKNRLVNCRITARRGLRAVYGKPVT